MGILTFYESQPYGIYHRNLTYSILHLDNFPHPSTTTLNLHRGNALQ